MQKYPDDLISAAKALMEEVEMDGLISEVCGCLTGNLASGDTCSQRSVFHP